MPCQIAAECNRPPLAFSHNRNFLPGKTLAEPTLRRSHGVYPGYYVVNTTYAGSEFVRRRTLTLSNRSFRSTSTFRIVFGHIRACGEYQRTLDNVPRGQNRPSCGFQSRYGAGRLHGAYFAEDGGATGAQLGSSQLWGLRRRIVFKALLCPGQVALRWADIKPSVWGAATS